jgi:hypothetical protein
MPCFQKRGLVFSYQFSNLVQLIFFKAPILIQGNWIKPVFSDLLIPIDVDMGRLTRLETGKRARETILTSALIQLSGLRFNPRARLNLAATIEEKVQQGAPS